MGAMMPKMRLAEAVMALPVPRSLVLKISGVYEYLRSVSMSYYQGVARGVVVNVQNGVHDVTREIVRTIPPEQRIRVQRGRGTIEKHAREYRGC
jgi:hypothetical protein